MPIDAEETFQLRIDDIAFGGKGVGRHNGFAIFVPFVVAGELVTVRITRRKKKFAEAELLSVDEPSPYRVTPPCPVFGACGGCAYQHIAYEHQLQLKTAQVRQTLRRLGRFDDPPVNPAIPSPLQYDYRNRIRVHVEGSQIGFYRHDSHQLVDITECPIASVPVNEQLTLLRRSLTQDGDYILSSQGKGEYFVQTNDQVAALLLDQVRSLISPSSFNFHSSTFLVDAYSGAGFLAPARAAQLTHVTGIEENQRAVEYARRVGGPNESYVAGDVAICLGDVLAAQPAAATCLLLDPPAIGAAPRVIELILGAQPAQLIYVSCNPATLARDLALLCRATYTLQSVTPIDMFPQTAEIESIAHLTLT